MSTQQDEDILDRLVSHQVPVTQFPYPFLKDVYTATSQEEKIATISHHFRAIMEVLGLDLSDASLSDTPNRVARMYVNEVFAGLDDTQFPAITLFPRPQSSTHTHSDIVISKTKFVSFCEHHFVPMMGAAYVGYIPSDQVIGLSKISRIVRYFAARPQLQERLAAQIGECLIHFFEHAHIAVYIRAQHCCVIARGAKDETAHTTTLYTSGLFHSSHEIRQNFLHMIQVHTSPCDDHGE